LRKFGEIRISDPGVLGERSCTASDTSHINLVGFYLVLLQLMLLNCVHQASISTRVNSSTSSRE